MSRTVRNLIKKYVRSHWGDYSFWDTNRCRQIMPTRRGEASAVQEIEEAGYIPSNRSRARGNIGNRQLPNTHDTVDVAALSEIDAGDEPDVTFPKVRSMAKRVVSYVISGCPECPWLDRGWFEYPICRHPSVVGDSSGARIEKVRYGRFPDWCPLVEAKKASGR